ncbi:hypothetical protein B0A49_11424 [Cryomyces minteri]|uniref:Transcription initiation factor IIB n=1 Tax=Cryomyces minteri TaxID=331657 RepID=A0A4U0WJ06_9PEZI|nr:hypothetical protein B0A49_11424 [Cryomyces minteri]
MATASSVLSPGAVVDPEPGPMKEPEWQENLNIHLICPDCKEDPPNLADEHASGDTVCDSCGLVLSGRVVDTRSEWRTFSNDDQGNDDPSRVGDAANPLLNGSQLQTSISFGDGSARAKELHRAQNKATHDKSTKTLLAAYKQIGALCDGYSMPHTVADTAKHLYKLTDDAKAFKGKSTDALIAGCIFIACRQNGVPRTFREVFELTKVSKKEIGKTFKALEKFFAAQNKEKRGTAVSAGGMVLSNDSYTTTTSTNPGELCIRFCSILGLDQRCTMISQDLANQMATAGALAGRSPLSAAAACIYMASSLMGQPRTPKQISEAAKVSDSTIRNAYKYLYQEKEKLINPEWLTKGGDMSRLPVAS